MTLTGRLEAGWAQGWLSLVVALFPVILSFLPPCIDFNLRAGDGVALEI